jgi:hypothetical protein
MSLSVYEHLGQIGRGLNFDIEAVAAVLEAENEAGSTKRLLRLPARLIPAFRQSDVMKPW